MRAVDKRRLRRAFGRVRDEELGGIDEALVLLLGLSRVGGPATPGRTG